jgi:hypothetical protein
MEANSDSHNDAQRGDQNPLPVTHPAPKAVEVPAVDPPIPARKQNEAPADPKQEHGCYHRTHNKQPCLSQIVDKNNLSLFERRTILLGWIGLGIGFLSLLAASIAGFLIYHQWWEMNTQSGYMNRAAIQARKDSADSSISTQKQVAIAQQQAQAAQDSVKAIQRQTQIAERAWITVDIVNLDPAGHPGVDISNGKPFIVRALFHDTGHTPALAIKAIIKMDVVTVKSPNGGFAPPSFTYDKAAYIPGGILTPGSFTNQDFPASLDKNTFAKIETAQRLYIHGEIKYRDVFETDHWMKFCYFLSPGGLYGTCRFHNQIDRN